MPMYEYLCESCGLKFDKLRKMSESDAPQACLECGTPARKLVSASNHAFSHPASQTRGVAPPNTGTSDDYNFDKAIGRDATRRWEGISQRMDRKRSVIKENPGATGYDLSRNHDGSYRVMSAQERTASESGRALGAKVQQAIQAEKKNDPSS